MFEAGEVDALARDLYAFEAQPEFLFHAGFTRQADFAARAQHALPRNGLARAQCPNYLARRAGKSGGRRNGAVGGYFAFGDAPNL